MFLMLDPSLVGVYARGFLLSSGSLVQVTLSIHLYVHLSVGVSCSRCKDGLLFFVFGGVVVVRLCLSLVLALLLRLAWMIPLVAFTSFSRLSLNGWRGISM